jgi:hypothetical protein
MIAASDPTDPQTPCPPLLDQQLHKRLMPLCSGYRQRRLIPLILRLHLSALLDQQLRDRLMPDPRRPLQRRPIAIVLGLHVSPLLDQQLYNRFMPILCSQR